MADHVFDAVVFRAQFPQFADPAKYPTALLQSYFDTAGCYIDPNDTPWFYGDCLQGALYLMTAHLAFIYTPVGNIIPGVGIITSSTVDRVSVTQQVPKTDDAWRAFFLRSPYGLQLVALLEAQAAGGWLVAGSLERQAFRKAGGRF